MWFHSYHFLPKVTICFLKLPFVAQSHHLLPKVTICCSKLPFVAKSYRLLPKATICCPNLPFVAQSYLCCPKLPFVAQNYHLLPKILKCCPNFSSAIENYQMLPINLHKIIPTLVFKSCPDTISSCSRGATQLHNCCPNLSIVAQKASHLKASFHPSIKPTMVAAISSSHEGASLRPRPRMSCGFGSTLPLIRLIHQLMLQHFNTSPNSSNSPINASTL